MGSSPSNSIGDWGGEAPTDQAPMTSSNPPISYTGSFGQPSDNFQGMGKSPQMGAPPMQQAQPPMQAPPMQQPMQQGSPYPMFNNMMQNQGRMGYDGGVSPERQYFRHTGMR